MTTTTTRKQHREDRSRSSGYIRRTMCGREMPHDSEWGGESCESCARVVARREEAAARAVARS
jgi:hypothetical protein